MKLRAARARKREKTSRCEGRKGYAEAVPETVAEARRLRVKGKSYRASQRGAVDSIREVMNVATDPLSLFATATVARA